MVASQTHRARRRLSAALTILVLLVAACSATDEPESKTPSATPDSSEATSPSPSGTEPDESSLNAIASAGIAILAADGSIAYAAEAPATGVELTEDQASALLAQAQDRSGTPGATLDSLAPSEIPMSALLAAYARGVDTPAAELAASLLEPQDLTHPETVVFPALVTTLFSSDMAHALGDQDATSLSLSAYTPMSGLCSDVTGTLYKGINAIFDALHVKQINLPKTGVAFLDGLLQGLTDMVVKGVNYLIEAGRILVINLVKYTLDKVLSIVAKVAALAAMVGNFYTLLSPVHVKVDTTPTTAPKGAPDLVHVKATATATVDAGLGALEWPEWFEDCANVAGVSLPPLKPVGEKVEWSILAPEPGLLMDSGKAGSPDPVLLDGGRGTAVGSWELVTGTEPAGLEGSTISSVAVVRAVVGRSQVAKLRDVMVQLGVSLLTDALPPIIKGYLHNALVGVATKATDGFVKLLSASGWTAVEVTYHEPGKKPKPGPKPGREVWEGQWANPGYGSSGTFTMDVVRTATSMEGSLKVFGADCISSGQLTALVNGDQVQFGLVSGGIDQINFTGVIEGNHVAGSWNAGEGCGGWTGPWQAVIK